jgi:hypothetical protein
MRLVLALTLLAMTSCNVASDAANEQVTLEYNKQQIRDTAVKAGETAKTVASGLGNVAAATGRAIKKEIGEVEVDIKRTPPAKAK